MVRLYLQVWCWKGLRYLQLKSDLTKKTLNHSRNLHDVANNNNNNNTNDTTKNNNNDNDFFYNNNIILFNFEKKMYIIYRNI